MPSQPIIFNQWELGVADSPEQGIGLIRNGDIESFPGALKVGRKPRPMFLSINTVTFTAVAGTDVCTASGTIEANGNNFGGGAVVFSSTGTLPAGLSANTIYFLIQVTATTFKVATSWKNAIGTAAGTVVDITDAGTGTHTMTMVPVGTVLHMDKAIRTNGVKYYFAQTSTGRVWFSPDSGIGGNGAGFYYLLKLGSTDTGGALVADIGASFKGGLAVATFGAATLFLFAFRDTKIDTIQVSDNDYVEQSGVGAGWTVGWKTMTGFAGKSHHVIWGNDLILYYCDGPNIETVSQNAGFTFDPATAGTYTHNISALDLPQPEIANWIEQHDDNLLIAGETFNRIYPWDRISDSFNHPIIVPEVNIKKIKNVSGTVFIFAGTWGNIYTTQGLYVKFFKKIPTYITNNAGTIQSDPTNWGGVAPVGNAILIGLSSLVSGNSGLYRLYFDGRLIQENTPSNGSSNVTAILAENEFFQMGYTGGIDNFSNAARYTSFETVAHSPLYTVGNKVEKATLSRLEVQMAKIVTTGHFRIKYRTDTLASFADFPGATISETADSTNSSWSYDVGLVDIENLQIQVEMDGDFELMHVILTP